MNMRRTTLGPVPRFRPSREAPSRSDSHSLVRPTRDAESGWSTTSVTTRVSRRARATTNADSSIRGTNRTFTLQRLSHTCSGRPTGSRSDPRPLTDKRYIQKSAKSLVSFLMERGYDQLFSSKMFTNPSAVDFQCIFEFMVQQIDSSFTFQRKMEEEVPIVLRCLGYPFRISKSALSAVGSPHTWPTLLGSLMWLLGLLRYDESRQQSEKVEVDTDPKALREFLFYENNMNAYFRFLQGEDTFPDLDDELLRFFEFENLARQAEVKNLESDCHELANTLHTLNSQTSPLKLITDHRAALQNNIEKYLQLIAMLAAHERQVFGKLQQKQDEISQSEEQISVLVEEKKKLRKELGDQEEAGIVAEKVVSEKTILQESLRAVNNEFTSVQRQFHEQQSRLSTKTAGLEGSLKNYERMATALVQPPGLDESIDKESLTFEISEDIPRSNYEQILSKDIDKDILPAIEKIRDMLSKLILKLQDDLLSLEEQTDRDEEVLIVARNERSLAESRANNLERDYKQCCDVMRTQLEERSKNMLRREEQLKESHDTAEARRKAQEDSLRENSDLLRIYMETLSRRRRRLEEIAREYACVSEEYRIEVVDSLSIVQNHFRIESGPAD